MEQQHPIETAYQAHRLIPLRLYQTNQLKKVDNPVVAAPALLKAMVHVGEKTYTFAKARRAVNDLAYDRNHKPCVQSAEMWKAHLANLQHWDALLTFLDTLAIFLKAKTPKNKGDRTMREFEPQTEQPPLKRCEISKQAQGLASGIDEKIVLNKLKQLGAHVTAARDQWEALAALARFYPRKGIPKGYVDALVALLETVDLRSFKQVVTQSLIFYEANQS